MRKILFTVVASGLLLSSCADKNQYTIKGTIPADQESAKMAYLFEYQEDWSKPTLVDSTVIDKNNFTFQGIKEKVTNAIVTIGEPNLKAKGTTAVIIEPGVIQLAIDEKSQVTGTPMNDATSNFKNSMEAVNEELEALGAKYEKATTDEEKDSIEAEADKKDEERTKLYYEYAKSNMTNQVGVLTLVRNSHKFDLGQLKELASQIPSEYNSNSTVEKLNNRIDILDKTKEGEKYTDLKGKNIAGKEIALSDYVGKNKYVLVDFWASWCPPCRKDMPEVVEIYKTFKKKGFEIVGISLDNDADKWAQGVKDLNITWPQMSDLKGWKSELSGAYGVNSIPHMMLLDKDGKIVARGLHPTQLKEKLTELLK